MQSAERDEEEPGNPASARRRCRARSAMRRSRAILLQPGDA
jgi:hypothetical protein